MMTRKNILFRCILSALALLNFRQTAVSQTRSVNNDDNTGDMSRPYHQREIELVRNAIDRCGRPIVLSLSPGETPIENAQHVKDHANMWRMVDDVWDVWKDVPH